MACKDCKQCEKKGLLILPLRYSAVVADNPEALKSIPDMPGKLGTGVKDIALTHGKYAPRLLREGTYLYALIERASIKSWEGYLVLENSQLYKFEVDTPPSVQPSPACNRDGTVMHAFMVGIQNAQDVKNVWFLYSPSPMTKAKLAEYKKDPAAMVKAGKMQHFSPQSWVGGTIEQEHTLLSPELHKHVVEYILYNQHKNALNSPLGLALKTHLFPAVDLAYAGTPPDENGRYQGYLGGIFHNLKRNGGAAFVMHDHIGITQELNDFRNAALAPVQHFLSTKDKAGITNEHKLEVIQAIKDAKGAYVKAGMSRAAAHIQSVDSGHQLPNFNAEHAKNLRASGRIAEAEQFEEQARKNQAAKARTRHNMLSGAEAEKVWNKKYETLLAPNAIKNFKDAFKEISDKAGNNANARAGDHAKWVVSDRLVDAFDVYDKDDLTHGVFFTKEHLHCTFGMFGVEKNLPTLVKWVNITKVDRKNLYMRANFFNQQEIEDEAGKAFQEARQQVEAAGGLAHVSNTPYMKAVKGFVDLMKKADSAWDEWLRDKVVLDIHQDVAPENLSKESKLAKSKPKIYSKFRDLSKFHRSVEGIRYAQFNELTQALSSKAGKMDKGIQAVVGTLLYGHLGKLAHEIGMEDLMLKVPKEKLEEGYKKRKAERNQALAERKAGQKMSRALEQMEDPIDTLIKDEQDKLKRKVKLTLEQIDKGERPETNNFRQARMGVLLMAIEGLSLTLKLNNPEELSARGKAEVAASVMSLTAMGIDIVYACAKSLREIEPYKGMRGVDTAADVIRGGLKITAGALSAAAGGIGVALDITSIYQEAVEKENTDWVLVTIYTLRGINGGVSVGLGMIAAASYSAPVLTRLAATRWAKYLGGAARLGRAATYIKEGIALTRTIWLIRVARFNLIGLVITVGEIAYRCCIMDDELEKWFKRCTFRKDMSKPSWGDKEFEELEKAYLATQEG